MSSIAYFGYSDAAEASVIRNSQSTGHDDIVENTTNNPIINIHVSCKDLPKTDLFGSSDPLAVLYAPDKNGEYKEVARSEILWNTLNPKFVNFFQAMYIFQENQPLRIKIFDVDSKKNTDTSKHDYIGQVDFDLQYLVSYIDVPVTFDIVNEKRQGKTYGQMIIVADQLESSRSTLSGQMKIEYLYKGGKKDLCFFINKVTENEQVLPVYRSNTIKGIATGKTCEFEPFQIPLQNICGGDIDKNIDIRITDRSDKKNIKDFTLKNVIGKGLNTPDTEFISLRTLVENVGKEFVVGDNKGETRAKFSFTKIEIIEKPTFIDYIRGGLKINMITGIDYSLRNGDPTEPTSFHHISDQKNQYEKCIETVGAVLCPYDSDQAFPFFGFGGKVHGEISQCFPISLDLRNPNVHGLDGLLKAYRDSLNTVELSEPSNLASFIGSASRAAQQSFKSSKTYTIALIITNGTIDDITETTNAVVEASKGPISIVIVGIGNGDFSQMKILDADVNPLISTSGKTMERDIVQFVPFNQYENDPSKLTSELLREIPRQVEEFCKAHNFTPKLTKE